MALGKVLQMKILITGLNSYIGKNLKIWILQKNPDFFVDLISVRDTLPTVEKLSNYDVVIHLAAIVHQVNKKSKNEYYKVNTELTEKLAILSKKALVSQFIFFSTMSVYGASDKMKEKSIIDKNTACNPKTLYGKSKYLAEQKLNKLKGNDFLICIVRPPMVYGENCNGNYAKLSKLAKYISVFPLVENERSMININSLSELVRIVIIKKIDGIITPQDLNYSNTSDLVLSLRKKIGKKIYLSKFLGFLISNINISLFSKIFGNLVYAKEISSFVLEYNKEV